MSIKKKNLETLKNKYKVGDTMTFDTVVWVTTNQREAIRVVGTIDGVYKHGIMLSFHRSNWKGDRKLTRWLSYVDIMIAKINGAVPFVSIGISAS